MPTTRLGASSIPPFQSPALTDANAAVPTWEAAKTHLMSNVCKIKDDSPIWKALKNAGLEDLTNFTNLTPDELKELEYQPDGINKSGDPLPKSKLNLGERKKLQLLGCFLVFIGEEQGSLEVDDVMHLTKEDYQEFCLTRAHNYIVTTTAASGRARTMPGGSITASTTPQHNKLVAFQKLIKRDPLIYLTLKDKRFLTLWIVHW